MGVLIFLGLAGLFFYFIPWIVAGANDHPNQAGIALLNLFLGWTLIGWVVALVWAVSKPNQVTVTAPIAPTEPVPATRECPFCAETILVKAKVCKHCGRDVPPQWSAPGA